MSVAGEPPRRGSVAIVGAGPGDPALLTLAAHAAIGSADVIACDRLVGASIRLLFPASARVVEVGKGRGLGAPQDEITRMLIREAKAGARVVRLKGGDPFVFGRGAEEVRAVRDAGVPVRVIPGLSSAYAAPAAAGVSITERGVASTIAVLTATGAEGPRHDWRSATHAETLVILMGLATISEVSAALLAVGRDGSEPAVAIMDATLATQRVVDASLATLAAEVEGAELSAPVTIVVGKAADPALRLMNTRTVLLTRPADNLALTAAAFGAYGFASLCDPAISIVPTDDPSLVDLTGIEAIAFTSANGVRSFFRALQHDGRDARALAGVLVASIGKMTASVLSSYGIRSDLIAKVPSSVGLGEAFPPEPRSILLPQAWDADPGLASTLRAAGHGVTERVAYTALPIRRFAPTTVDALRTGSVEAIALFSAATARAAAAAMRRDGLDPVALPAVCAGAPSAEGARKAGFPIVAIADDPSPDALARALADA